MVTAKNTSGLSAELKSGVHALISDVPIKLGGQDQGPGPHELLESALAACTVITVKMYTERKGWATESIEARVEITEEKPEGTKILRNVTFRGNLSEEQRARMLDIANHCPIHRLLSGKVEIETILT